MRKISSSLAPKPPAPPAPPSPPVAPMAFPINLPGATPPAIKSQRSLFKDMFGTDHSILALALDSNWANHEQKELAQQVLSGHKSISKLTAAEQDVLDGIVHSYDSSGGGAHAYDSVQTGSERLSVSGDDSERGENLQSGSEDGVQDRSSEKSDGGDGPDFSDAYGWTK